MSNHVQTWTPEQTRKALRMRLDGVQCRMIDFALGKKEGSTRSKLRRLTVTGLWDGTAEGIEQVAVSEMRRVNEWTRAEMDLVRREWLLGTPINEISDMLPGRTPSAVSSWAKNHNLRREAARNDASPWYGGPRHAEIAVYAGCRISVVGDCPEATRAFTARLVASAALFSQQRETA